MILMAIVDDVCSYLISLVPNTNMGEIFATVVPDATRQLHEEDVTLLSVNHTLSDLTNSCVGGCVFFWGGGGDVFQQFQSHHFTHFSTSWYVGFPKLHGHTWFFCTSVLVQGGHMILS